MAGFFSDFFGGGQPNLPYNPPQMPERFLNPSPVPEMQTNSFRQSLIGAKSDWDTANRQLQGWQQKLDETPDLTDEERQRINSNIQGWSQKRDAAAQSATDIRNQADAMGIDVSAYGSDKTLQESARAYNTYRNAAVRDFLNLPSVNQLEESRYTELLNRGVSPRTAKSIISDERAGREEDFLRRAEEGIMTYGLNPDGSLNGIGLTLARRLNPSDPAIAAQLYTGAFALPKNVFTEGRTDNRVVLASDAAAQRQAHRSNLGDYAKCSIRTRRT